MKKHSIDLRFVLYQEGGYWLAHSLEFDIVAEAKDPVIALSDLFDLCAIQLRFAADEGDFNSVFRSAPPEIWAMYARSKSRDLPIALSLEWPEAVGVDKIEVRELELCNA